MATLTPGEPLVTDEPALRVDNRFEAGTSVRFALRVFDDDGNASEPDVVEVRVGARQRGPLAVLLRRHRELTRR